MAMSSYLINSNYVDPQFPPCEEYSHSDYLPSHSPDYYSPPRPEPAAFQPDSVYAHPQSQSRPQPRAQPPYTSCQRAAQPASVLTPPRGHAVRPAGVSEQNRRCESVTPSPPPPPSCGQTTNTAGGARKDPVVYPWMKKVHVNIGKPSWKLYSPPPSSLSLLVAAEIHAGIPRVRRQICFCFRGAALLSGSGFTVLCLQGQYNYTLHKFLLPPLLLLGGVS